MATMLATITKVPHSEYRPFPLLFSDSNWGSGDEKNVNNIGHGRYWIFGQKFTFPVAVSLFVLPGFVAYSDRAKLEIRDFFEQNSALSASKMV